MDAARQPSIDAREMEQLDHSATALPPGRFTRVWQKMRRPGEMAPLQTGVFATALGLELDGFRRALNATVSLDFGLGNLIGGKTPRPESVVGAMNDMFVEVPRWLGGNHARFSIIYSIYGTLLWALLAGAISRMAALHATRNIRVPTGQALAYAAKRYFWYLLTPAIPLLLCAIVAGLMYAGGWMLIRAKLEIVGGALFGLALFGGVLITVVLALLMASAHMIFPALSIEGTDGMDALSRLFYYAGGRPIRWLFYNLVALVYGAITYLLLGMVIFMALLITHGCVGGGVTSTTSWGVNRFEAIWPEPQFASLPYQLDWDQLGTGGKLAAAAVWVWIFLLAGLLAAYAVNYYICANTWVYLLLRRAADGTDFDEVYLPKSLEEAATTITGPAGTGPAPGTGAAMPDEIEAPDDAPRSEASDSAEGP
jgi:hypothetical protein